MAIYPLLDLPSLPTEVDEDLVRVASALLGARWQMPVDAAEAALTDTAFEMGVEVDALCQLVVASLTISTDPLLTSTTLTPPPLVDDTAYRLSGVAREAS